VLGAGFSGNGDLLTFLLRARSPERTPYLLEASYGPVITSAIEVPHGDGRRGHFVQDAGYPVLASWLAEASGLHRAGRRFVRLRARQLIARLLRRTADVDLGAEFGGLLGDAAMSSSSMPLLSMGRDVPGGRFSLDREGRLTTSWSSKQSRGYFQEVERTVRAIAEELHGEWRDSRFWPVSKLVTVHPLGGCAMGSDPAEGVVDAHGEVFGHPGFFIADGSVMPGPVGPNPSLTIAALANRFAGRMLGLA
jgi:cholesterol oxidase